MSLDGPTEKIIGYDISTLRKEECVRRILNSIESKQKGGCMVCANPHSIEIAQTDKELDFAIKNADLVIPDGVGMIYASIILGGTIRARVTGSDVFWGLTGAMNERGGFSCFFLGATEDTLGRIVEKMGREFPNVRVAGTLSPPFKSEFTPEENRKIIEAVNRARPDVLWIGMTAPKQEKWAFKHRNELEVSFICPVGAVFDFYTGRIKRAHTSWQKIGLEWLPRWLQEPRRLWRRNLVSSPRFIARVIMSKFRQK